MIHTIHSSCWRLKFTFPPCLAAINESQPNKHSWTITLNSLLPHFKAVPASYKNSLIFFFCRLHCLISYTPWHYSWFCFTCCFIFPTALDNCNLNITPVRQRTEEHNFPFLHHPQSLCTRSIYNFVKN